MEVKSYMLTVIRNLELYCWNAVARIQFFLRGVRWPLGLSVRGPLGIAATGTIQLGERITIINSSRYNRAGVNHPTQLVSAKGALLSIGDNVGISGASIFCVESIVIGNHVMIGASCRIYDTDFHALDHLERRVHKMPLPAPVVIEDDVWLCANVTVLKGVTIGARSVIAAGSIVTHDIPPDSLAGGIPAKTIRSLVEPSA